MDKPRKPGRPKTTGRGTIIGARWHADDLKAIDAYAKKHGIERTEAIRELVRLGLIQAED